MAKYKKKCIKCKQYFHVVNANRNQCYKCKPLLDMIDYLININRDDNKQISCIIKLPFDFNIKKSNMYKEYLKQEIEKKIYFEGHNYNIKQISIYKITNNNKKQIRLKQPNQLLIKKTIKEYNQTLINNYV